MIYWQFTGSVIMVVLGVPVWQCKPLHTTRNDRSYIISPAASNKMRVHKMPWPCISKGETFRWTGIPYKVAPLVISWLAM